MSKIQDVTSNNEDIFEQLDIQFNRTLSYWQMFKGVFGSCYGKGKLARKACYIMTIGVLDECRKLGIGTMLLQYLNDRINESKWAKQVEFIYLHVISYNKAALNFYKKNEFKKSGTLKDHYEVFKKNYDAIVLYRQIQREYVSVAV